MMKHLPFKTTIALLVFATFAIAGSPAPRAAVRAEHPRVWLTPEFKTALQARYARNTTNARNLRTWCDSHMNDDLSPYITNRATEILKAINYALMYQLTGTASYANRAIQIIEYALAHPYSGYTIDTWIDFDNFYTTRYLVPPVALVTDWCWAAMTDAQRTAFVAQLDRWLNRVMTTEPWAWHDPSNNFYYGYTWAFLAAGYAMYGHNANAQTYINYARDTMLDQGIKFTKGQTIMWDLWGSNVGRANGGQWNEGTAYGCVNYEFLCSAVLAVKSAEGLPYSDFTFPDEAVKFYIYSKYPSGSLQYSDGDGAAGGIDATVRIPVLFNIALATGDTKRYGQQWVNTYTSNCDWGYKLYNEFLWYDDQISPLAFGTLPDYDYLDGTQTLFWRSDWTTNAVWVAMKLGVLNSDHAHNGLGNVMIFKGGFLATDKAAETGDVMASGDIQHNVLYIPPVEDKKLFWGESKREHFANTANYLYLAGDLSGCYLAQPDYRSNTVEHKEREILIVKPENAIVVMDRGTSFDAARDKVFQIYLHNQAVQSGSQYRSANGSADLVIHRAFPAVSTVTLDTYGPPRLRISTTAAELSKSFLNVLKVSAPGAAFVSPQATTNTTDVAAAAFVGASDPVDYVAAFSTDPQGDPSTVPSFSISFERNHGTARAYIANLSPNTAYFIGGSTSGTTGVVTVSRTAGGSAIAYQSDANGFIFCEVNLGEAEAPPPPPHPVGID
jgi:hypothetical protein